MSSLSDLRHSNTALINSVTTPPCAAHPPLVGEVIGPAGAGKTTLLRAMSRRHHKIQRGIRLPKAIHLPYRINNTCALLPLFLRQYPHSRWFDRRERRSMVYLKAWLYMLAHQTPADDTLTILDHGPLYLLTRLREYGPELRTSPGFQKWWTSLLNRWTDALQLIIWVDAPNAVLWERIRSREHWHLIKDASEHDAHEFLTGYRAALERIVDESVTGRPIKLFRFDTSRHTPDEMAAQILDAFDPIRQKTI
jgi:hypothetical protein